MHPSIRRSSLCLIVGSPLLTAVITPGAAHAQTAAPDAATIEAGRLWIAEHAVGG